MRTALLLALLAAPAAALDLDAMTEAERDAFGAEVRAYLLDNPEVLMEAIGVLEAREAEAQAAAAAALLRDNAALVADDGHSWVGGNPEGNVTLVEFMDYRCGYCRQAFAEVEALVASDGNLRFVLKELPILGEQSEAASRFAVAVQQLHGPDAYKDVHDALFSLRGDVTPDALARLAEGLALDPQPIMDRMGAPEVSAVLDANRALAESLRISGTPTFVLGDRMVRGYLPPDEMRARVEAARAG